MVVTFVPSIYDELIDYLAEKATPEEILAFKPSLQAQNRATDLLERNNAGTITPIEYLELQQMMHFDRRIALLKAKATIALKKS